MSEERNIFCVRVGSNDRLAIVEVKEVSARNRCLYVSLNLNSSLKKEIRPYFLIKNWKIQNKLYLEDERAAGLALLEYNFAEMDLRSCLGSLQDSSRPLARPHLHSLVRDLMENLCLYHLDETTILDIRPETILFEDGRWFILNGDCASRSTSEFGSPLSRPIAARFADRRYLAPLLLESQAKGDANLMHNPYKSDVFSLGLVLLELVTLGVLEKAQFR